MTSLNPSHKTGPTGGHHRYLITIMLENTTAATALNWLIATGQDSPLIQHLATIHAENLAIAHRNTRAQSRELIRDALDTMPQFLGKITPDDLENLVTELLPSQDDP